MIFSPPPTSKWLVPLLALTMLACGPVDDDNDQTNGDPDQTAEIPGDVVKSELSRDTDPQVGADTFGQFSADNRDFAFSLLDELRADQDGEGNFFISPHSVSVALAMIYGGAQENTKAEMADVMRFQLDDDQLHPAFNKLDLALASRSDIELDDEENQAFTLDIVNQTWGQTGFDFVDDYLDMLAVNYGAAMSLVDFVSDYEQIRQDINAWVEDQTKDRIVELLPEDSLQDDTRFVLVNAIYFYGSWASPFNESATSEQAFHLLDGSTADVPMMRQDASFPWATDEDSGSLAVSLPYVGEEVSMVAIMPDDEEADFAQWEAQFDRAAFDAVVDQLAAGRIYLSFPRFEDEGAYELKEIFEVMGMIDAFDSCDADFSGVTGHPPCINFKSLYISDIFHKAFISVDEEGTEAAAATGVVGATPTSMPPEVNFDRPFIYAIYDHPTETILFLGRMVDPTIQ